MAGPVATIVGPQGRPARARPSGRAQQAGSARAGTRGGTSQVMDGLPQAARLKSF
jgi:hypothetical protein